MKRLLAALLLLSAPAGALLVGDNSPAESREAPASGLRDLTTGRYELVFSGVLCSECLRGLARELAADPAVASASPDLDKSQVLVAIKKGKTLKVRALRRDLKRAQKRVNLGAKYEVAAVRYVLAPIEPDLPAARKPAP